MRNIITAMAMAALLLPAPVVAAGAVTPLFRDDAPLAVTLSGPVRRIALRAPTSTEAHPGTMAAGGETLAVSLAARGVSRRERNKCGFPPLRVRLDAKPAAGSLFQRQRGLKLVTHCNTLERFEQHLLREYAAYRLYNLITPESFRVRLLRVTYVDEGKALTTKWGFFIEDADDAARRIGKKELTIIKLPRRDLDQRAAARFALFQYMIGNTDWEMTEGPPGNECCHNAKLASTDIQAPTSVTPLPYDFDSSGLVGAPYAAPSELLPIRTVTQRLYRGYCAANTQMMAEAERFRQARPAMETMLAGIPGLTDASRKAMLRYLDGFFADIASPDTIQKKLVTSCR